MPVPVFYLYMVLLRLPIANPIIINAKKYDARVNICEVRKQGKYFRVHP